MIVNILWECKTIQCQTTFSLCFLSVFLNSLPFNLRCFMNTHLGRTWKAKSLVGFSLNSVNNDQKGSLGSPLLPPLLVAHWLDSAPLAWSSIFSEWKDFENVWKSYWETSQYSFHFRFLLTSPMRRTLDRRMMYLYGEWGESRLKCQLSIKERKIELMMDCKPFRSGLIVILDTQPL